VPIGFEPISISIDGSILFPFLSKPIKFLKFSSLVYVDSSPVYVAVLKPKLSTYSWIVLIIPVV